MSQQLYHTYFSEEIKHIHTEDQKTQITPVAALEEIQYCHFGAVIFIFAVRGSATWPLWNKYVEPLNGENSYFVDLTGMEKNNWKGIFNVFDLIRDFFWDV